MFFSSVFHEGMSLVNRDGATAYFADEEASQIRELVAYIDTIFDAFGVKQQAHSAGSIIIETDTHMLQHHFSDLSGDDLTAPY